MKNKAYKYAKDVMTGKVIAPKYVVMQCAEFLSIADGKDHKYIIDEKKVETIENLLRNIYLFKGRKVNVSLYEASSGNEWLLYIASLCTVHRDDRNRRRYRTIIEEIARKNHKSSSIAVIFILLFLLEPPFSRLFSVAPTGELSREVMLALSGMIKASPSLYSDVAKDSLFKIRRDDIICKMNDSVYKPLNYSNDKLDGKEPTAFVVDEAGALGDNPYAINAMESGQLTVINPLGFIISTKYPTSKNAFEDQIDLAKKVLDGVIEDETIFALLYEPDEPDKWMTDDNVLLQANPVAPDDPDLWNELLRKRELAIAMESARENFLTKHCNITYAGLGTTGFIDMNLVQQGRIDDFDWNGKEVYLGVDLSMTTDNCSVAMVAEHEGGIVADVYAFIPADKVAKKSIEEKVDYEALIRSGKCIPCGDSVVDYSVIEDFVFDIEEKFGVTVMGIGYDRYNALSSAQKWERGKSGDGYGYNTVIVRQHSDTLHMPTKLLVEMCEQGKFHYTANKMLEINFENARCTEDTNLNKYVNKKRSRGKVDMVVALINGIYLLQQDMLLGEDDWVIQ